METTNEPSITLYVVIENEVKRKGCWVDPEYGHLGKTRYTGSHYYYADDGIGIRAFHIVLGEDAFENEEDAILSILPEMVKKRDTITEEVETYQRRIEELRSWNRAIASIGSKL